jgi:hypothetical protein
VSAEACGEPEVVVVCVLAVALIRGFLTADAYYVKMQELIKF